MLTHQQFKDKYLGKLFDVDGAAGAQCVDVDKAYIAEVQGKRWRATGNYPTAGGAINAYLNYPNSLIYGEDYNLIENNWNDPNCQPIQGDHVIWGEASGLTTSLGHIAVCESANNQNFTSIDQNWNTGKGLQTQMVNHTYRGVLGWLRLKQPVTPPEPQPSNEFRQVETFPGDTQWKIAKRTGYPVTATGDTADDRRIYDRLTHLNPETEGKIRPPKLYNVDHHPLVWFNPQPQPEAITTPAPTPMSSISIENQPEQALQNQIEQKQEDKQEIVKQVVDELKKQIPQADTAGQATKEKFDFSKLSVGVVRAENPITTPPIFATIGGAIGVLNENKPEITLALTLIGTALGMLYPIAVKFLDRLKLIAEALNSKK